MDVFADIIDSGDKDDSNASDDVQMTLEEAGEDAASMGGVVTSLTLDANGQYQFRTDTPGQGSVTYRVVQVTQGEDGQPQVLAGLPQQSIFHSLTNGATPIKNAVSNVEPKFTYIPTVNTGIDTTGLTAITTSNNPTSGQFYLMMAPPDSLQSGQRPLAPRFTTIKTEGGVRVSRDDRRRATHNEVERRRRDKINTWIAQLGRLVPDCAAEQSRQGDSKGGILSKTCEYILELQNANAQMASTLKETERIAADSDLLRQQYKELKQENEHLRAELQQNGIEPADLQPH